ncbi:hypothetical protein [Actinomadura fulvescens]|uniref:hypothetical protein n=1 Tax=Actinomadura fulvescens TaxID=46160 RepID=UPI00397B6D2E
MVSHRPMHERALAHREAPWAAVLIPSSEDCIIVAPSMSVLLATPAGDRGGWLGWPLVAAGQPGLSRRRPGARSRPRTRPESRWGRIAKQSGMAGGFSRPQTDEDVSLTSLRSKQAHAGGLSLRCWAF